MNPDKYDFQSSFSLLVQTSREFWCTDNVALYVSTTVSETFGNEKTSESSTLVPTSLEEV